MGKQSRSDRAGDLQTKIKWSEDLIQKTIKLWAPKMGRDPTREEAIEMLNNVSGFLRILLELDSERGDGNEEQLASTSS